MKQKSSKQQTVAIHAGRNTDPITGAVVAPLYLNTTFERSPDGSYPKGFDYIRDGHPNRAALEKVLATLECGAEAAVFASGSAASMAVLFTCGRGHVVAGYDSYHGSLAQLRELVPRWGTEVSFVATTDVDAVATAMRPDTSLVWIETPSNPLLRVSDIAAISRLTSSREITLAVDNTFATPILQQPLLLGADLVIHSTTKFIGGHSDVCGGVVIGNERRLIDGIRHFHKRAGAVASAFDCWLLQRSLATLPVRMQQHCDNAMALARFLEQHRQVEQVCYPGLASHPDHTLASRQMTGFGGVLSFYVPGGRDAAFAVAAGLTTITRATSLGGVESLIEHRASIEGPQTHAPENLLRLSVGLEHSDDLIDDLDSALRVLA